MFLHFAQVTLSLALCCTAIQAQVCVPAAIPIGQPGLIAFKPSCVGALPIPLPVGGNAGLAIAPGVMPTPPSLQLLVFTGFAPPPFAPLPPGLLCPGYGVTGTIPAALLGVFYVGVTGAGPLPPFPLPVPPGIPPGALFLTVQTANYDPFTGCIAISNGLTITN